MEKARTPNFDELWAGYRHTELTASGRAVGLPDGQMGNSEVGHLNLGAGAVVHQDLTRIQDAIADGSFFDNPRSAADLRGGRASGRLHLLGLVSKGGVHAGFDHLHACIQLAARVGVPDIVLHAFTDGRDTAPDSGAAYVAEAEGWLREAGGRVATVTGRYYAMDRDRRWDRTKLAYDAIVHGQADCPSAESGEAAVLAAYQRDETDEFIRPTLVGEEGRIRDGDAVLFFNFRPDRARELTRALAEPGFDEFDRGDAPRIEFATLTQYQEDWDYPVVFQPDRPTVTLASVLAERGGAQLHVAETEKYAHVTYFFNGGEEHEYPGEERYLVDSPRDVPTYDHKPEMSARAAAATFVEHWRSGDYRFAIINFANPDMVGHTGVIEAAVKAIETADEALGKVVEAVHEKGGACIVTADHGNADNMLEPDGSPNTAHSLNPVPLIVTADVPGLRDGGILGGRRADRPRPARRGAARRDDGPVADRAREPTVPSDIQARDGSARSGMLCHSARRDPHAGLRAAGLHGHGQGAARQRGGGAGLRDGARQHLPPLHPAGRRSTSSAWAACTSSWAGGGRSSPTRAASRSSRWVTARWPRRSRAGAASARAASCRSTRRACASAPTSTAASASWGPRPRWRSRPGSAPTSRSRSTSARPSTWSATTRPARPSARTAGSTAASTGSAQTLPRASCCTGSRRAACTRTCAWRPSERVAGSDVDGVAVGGSLGQEKDQMREVVGWALRPLRDEQPRHLLGIGDVDDILHAVAAGIDSFDCATPTRLGRHGTALVPEPESRWRLDLTRPSWSESREPIQAGCPCPACREHTRGYLHYLVKAGELTGARLITLHNLTFMKSLMDEIRAAVEAGELESYTQAVLGGSGPGA